MDKENEPIGVFLGEIRCPDCGGVAQVKRTKRRGNHYQSNCDECGIDQKVGPATQKRMAAYVPFGTLSPIEQEQTDDKPPYPVKVEPKNEPIEPAAKPRKYGLWLVVGAVAAAAIGLSN